MEKKYELTDETTRVGEKVLYRIRAVRTIWVHGVPTVRCGTLGGFVETEHNLSHEKGAWIAGDSKVYEHARIEGDALTTDNSEVRGNAVVTGRSLVAGRARVGGDVLCADAARIEDEAHVDGSVIVRGWVRLSGSVTLDGRKFYEQAECISGVGTYLVVKQSPGAPPPADKF